MKKLLLSLWILSVMFLSSLSAQRVIADEVRYFRLDNGMQVYLLSDPKAQNTKVRVSVAVGYDDENETNYGLSHLTEHIVFRDSRVPHSDYLDYIKEQGGIDVNGYTGRYTTDYEATIAPEKSEWLIKTFAGMLFDKQVDEKDLRVEKVAVQTEIGENHWYSRPLLLLKLFFQTTMPPQEGFYHQAFAMPKEKEAPDRYYARRNNQRFTLHEVMQRYHDYYYPANMKLYIAGNFDPNTIVKLIRRHFGTVKRRGSKTIRKVSPKGVLTGKPSKRFDIGAPQNYAYIGTKYIFDDYRTYLIMDIYSEMLAERLQQTMRNKLGKTYSVNDNHDSRGNAGVVSAGFDGLKEYFDDNIHTAIRMIESDSKGLDAATIRKALARYEQRYFFDAEHDTDTLMDMIETQEYLREEQNSTQSAYRILKTITPEIFNRQLEKFLLPQNRYEYVRRQYYFFPGDAFVLGFAALFLAVYLYIINGRRKLKKEGLISGKRDILFHRRLSSRWIGAFVILVTLILAGHAQAWLTYWLSKWLTGNPDYFQTIDAPWNYLFDLFGPLVYMAIFTIIFYYLWRYWATMTVTKKHLLIGGNRLFVIPKNEIVKLSIVSPKERKGGKSFGVMFRFWKPLLGIETRNGNRYYLRSDNARHLKEDLEEWIKQSKSTEKAATDSPI